MQCLNFPIQWISWISECLVNPSFLILINGSPFLQQKQRYQTRGSPLPLYLCFGNEILDHEKGRIQHIRSGPGLYVFYLLFTDDMLVFCKASVELISKKLMIYCKNQHRTWTKLNRNKRKLYFNKGCQSKLYFL